MSGQHSMTRFHDNLHRGRRLSRRGFLWELGGGLGGVALTAMLADAGLLVYGARGATTGQLLDPVAPRPSPHGAPRAKRVIQLFCAGAVSQVDTFDYKPELAKRQGKSFDVGGGDGQKVELFASVPGAFQQSYWAFRQHGQSGRWVSELFPHLATCVDDMAFVYSMTSKSAVHGPATFMANSGFLTPGFPCMGSWVTYGLGSENGNLPAFVVIPDARGVPPGGPVNWGAGFLPAAYQGTAIRSSADRPPIADLFPDAGAGVDAAGEADTREFLRTINRAHGQQRPGDTALEARIAAYELAARLQLAAPEATDLRGETDATKRLYGLDDTVTAGFGRQCLLARRLVERGVRFVQVWCGADNTAPPRANWDGHEDIVDNHGLHGRIFDRPAAALLKDLKSRGLLDDTLVICTSEFGRMCCAEQGKGRDHNPHAFTSWLAGGGIKGGTGYGASDDFSFRAVQDPAYCYDLHATALHLLGIDHEKLTFRHNGVDRRLTDVHGHVIEQLLA